MSPVTHTSARSCPAPHVRGGLCLSALSVGIIALALTKTADAVTTILGLTQISGVIEQNPVTAAFIANFGLVPGLAIVGLGSVVLVTLITEIGGRVLAGPGDHGEIRRLMRLTGFGSATVVSLIPVILNTRILIAHGIFF